MWHEILFRVLSILNYAVLILIAIPLLLQVFYVLFCFVKKTTYPKSGKKGKVAYIIPAHNEEDVIFQTVRHLLETQDYPRDKFDVYVVAHNCTDRTAELAREAGAEVFELNDAPGERTYAYAPVKFCIAKFLEMPKEESYDFVLRLDADNRVNPAFTSLMNDAFQSGVEFACPYEGALNGAQNCYTEACALFYAFDSRFGSRVRERFGIAAHVNGPGAMFSMEMLRQSGGYDCTSICEDAEFNFNRMLEGKKGRYVEDAVVFEDMPSSFRDTLNRNKRIGSGSMGLMRGQLGKMFGKFFTTGNFSYLEMFLTYSFNFLSVLFSIWLPAYYIYHFVYTGLILNGTIAVSMMPVSYYSAMLWNTIWCAVGIGGGLFVLFVIVQAVVLVMLDYQKLGATKRRQLIPGLVAFPVFLVLYAVTLCIGALSKPSWGKVKRNVDKGEGH